MARVELLELTDSNDEELLTLAEHFLTADGSVPNHFRAEAHFPEVLKHVFRARIALWESGPLPQHLMKKVAVAVSMANGCQYCTGAFCSMLDSDDSAYRFQQRIIDDQLGEFEEAVIDFALKVNENEHAVTDEDFQSLREGFDLSDRGFVQLVYCVNIISGYNRVTTVFDVEYDHSYPTEVLDETVETSTDK